MLMTPYYKTEQDVVSYRNAIRYYTQWCREHYLQLKVDKTKEMVFDIKIKNNITEKVFINNKEVEKVQKYKYLGVVFDDKSTKMLKQVNKKMYFMRKLYNLEIDKKIILMNHVF